MEDLVLTQVIPAALAYQTQLRQVLATDSPLTSHRELLAKLEQAQEELLELTPLRQQCLQAEEQKDTSGMAQTYAEKVIPILNLMRKRQIC